MSNFIINSYLPFGGVVSTGDSTIAITAAADDGFDLSGTWAGSGQPPVGKNLFGLVADGGFRFVGTAGNPLPPQGVTITSATFTIEVLTVTNSGGNIDVRGFDDDDAGAWNGVGPATMATTAAGVTRTLGTVQSEVFDIAAIVQELVDRGSWVGGDGGHLSLGVLDTTSSTNNFSILEPLEDAGGNEAVINIVW